jgi:hypothetical protein
MLMPNWDGRVLGYDAGVHSIHTAVGEVSFANSAGLLFPLSFLPLTQINSIKFPEGLFNFTIQGLNPTASVTVTINFPHALPSNASWWFASSGHWNQLSANQVSVSGANLTLTLTAASSNGVISIVGGPAVGSAPAQVTTTTSSANTSTSATSASTNIGGFHVESIAGGIIAGLVALILLRYRKSPKGNS